jgi:hypothetical protein
MSAGISSVNVTMGFGSIEGDPVTADILTLDTGDRFVVLKQVGLSLILHGLNHEAAANARQLALTLRAVAEELDWKLAESREEAQVVS